VGIRREQNGEARVQSSSNYCLSPSFAISFSVNCWPMKPCVFKRKSYKDNIGNVYYFKMMEEISKVL